jgi:dGTPase
VEVVPHKKFPQLHKVRLGFDTFMEVEVLKNVTYYAIIKSPVMQVVQYRGKDIIKKIFKAISEDGGIQLLPDDFRLICNGAPARVRTRAICDFIAGMTDRYAHEFYGRLFGTDPLTVYKPF